MLHNFVDFLYIFGHFAGEDLEEDEDDEGIDIPADEEALLDHMLAGPSTDDEGLVRRLQGSRRAIKVDTRDLPTERAPLLSREPSAVSPTVSRKLGHIRRSRRSTMGPHGDATVPQAILMLLKSFIGTGVLFLGKAFYNGGILFSTVTLVTIALISLYSFLLLVQTKFVVSGSFGDIGGTLYGPYMRYAILTSIVVSQLGFVCTYTIFVSENLQAFVMAVSKCKQLIPIQYFIFGQLIVFFPLALIRNIAKLSGIALVADAFILVGLVYIGSNEVKAIMERGFAEVRLFNQRTSPYLLELPCFRLRVLVW
jgi:proton-coupled amino acid transporter